MGLLEQLDITYWHAVPLCSHKGSEMGKSYFQMFHREGSEGSHLE